MTSFHPDGFWLFSKKLAGGIAGGGASSGDIVSSTWKRPPPLFPVREGTSCPHCFYILMLAKLKPVIPDPLCVWICSTDGDLMDGGAAH